MWITDASGALLRAAPWCQGGAAGIYQM